MPTSAKRGADLSEMDAILLRQDPPFDMAYITTTHFLEHIHPATLVVNDPAEVRNAPEKIFVNRYPDLMPPTLISSDPAAMREFRDEHGTSSSSRSTQRRRRRVPSEARPTMLEMYAERPRADHRPALPAGDPRRRRASSWSTAAAGASRGCQFPCRRPGEAGRADRRQRGSAPAPPDLKRAKCSDFAGPGAPSRGRARPGDQPSSKIAASIRPSSARDAALRAGGSSYAG